MAASKAPEPHIGIMPLKAHPQPTSTRPPIRSQIIDLPSSTPIIPRPKVDLRRRFFQSGSPQRSRRRQRHGENGPSQ